MVPTTLRTFLLETPSTITSVEVLGSWDNFTQPYPLDRDRGLGRGHWRGCHAFPNVGQKVRTVGLNMGSVYWYYYRFDGGEVDYHDPVEPSTTACPLLPGQNVNVLEVPLEVGGSPDGSTTALDDHQWTLDPNAKYSTPKPCDPAKHAKRAIDASAMANFHNAWKERSPQGVTPQSHQSYTDLPRPRSRQSSSKGFIEGVKKRAAWLRPSSSAVKSPKLGDSGSGPDPEQRRTLFGSSKRLLRSSKAERKSMFYKHQTNSVPTCGPGQANWDVPPLPAKAQTLQVRAPVNTRHGARSGTAYVGDENPVSTSSLLGTLECPPVPPVDAAFVKATTNQQPVSITEGHNLTLDEVLTDRYQSGPQEQQTDGRSDPNPGASQPSYSKPAPLDLTKSNSMSPDIAPSFTYTSTLSPCRLSSQLSQPATPSFRNFDDDFSWIRPESATLHPHGDVKTADYPYHSDTFEPHAVSTDTTAPVAGFQGYKHPAVDHASALTIKRLPSTTFSLSSHAEDLPGPEPRHEYVQAWNEGQKGHYLTGQQRLVEEMGYLGQAII